MTTKIVREVVISPETKAYIAEIRKNASGDTSNGREKTALESFNRQLDIVITELFAGSATRVVLYAEMLSKTDLAFELQRENSDGNWKTFYNGGINYSRSSNCWSINS
jgi:hypothetical protein